MIVGFRFDNRFGCKRTIGKAQNIGALTYNVKYFSMEIIHSQF